MTLLTYTQHTHVKETLRNFVCAALWLRNEARQLFLILNVAECSPTAVMEKVLL